MRYLDRYALYHKNKKVKRSGFLSPSIIEATEDVVEKIEQEVPKQITPEDEKLPMDLGAQSSLMGDEDLKEYQEEMPLEGDEDLEEPQELVEEPVEEPVEDFDLEGKSDEEIEAELDKEFGALEESVSEPEPEPKHSFPQPVLDYARMTNTPIEEIEIIDNKEEYFNARRKWGIPNILGVNSNDPLDTFGSRSGSIFVDDFDDGRVKAFAPSGIQYR